MTSISSTGLYNCILEDYIGTLTKCRGKIFDEQWGEVGGGDNVLSRFTPAYKSAKGDDSVRKWAVQLVYPGSYFGPFKASFYCNDSAEHAIV